MVREFGPAPPPSVTEQDSEEPRTHQGLSGPNGQKQAVSGTGIPGCKCSIFREANFMEVRKFCLLVIVLMVIFAPSGVKAQQKSKTPAKLDTGKIVVMNPRGIQPEIRKIPMATRPASLDGKTVYIVDIKYANTRPFVNELIAALKAKYPATNWTLKEKLGMYMDDDPNLWKEIKEKASGAIVLVGH
jgi:hypothetical protein